MLSTIRPLRADDGELLDAVFAGMSEQSRYQRFHVGKPRLTAAERAYLLDVDGHRHLAFVALAPDGSPLGIAHAVRLSTDTATAEVAAEVVDGHQREGVGTALMSRLARRAASVGIERLIASVLWESRLVRGLRRRGWRPAGRDGAAVTLAADVWRVAHATPPPAPARRVA